MKKKAKKQGKKATVQNIHTGWVMTKQEDRLMQTLIDPAARLLPVLELCRRAKVSKDVYYRAFDKPEFVALYRETVGNLFRRASAPLANALLREALRGSAPHLKIALELSGVFDPKTKVELDASVDVIQKISEADFIKWLKEAQSMGVIPNRILAENKKQEAAALPAPAIEAKPEPAAISVKPEPVPEVKPEIKAEPVAPVASQQMYHPPTPQEVYNAKNRGTGWTSPRRWRRS